MNHPEEERLVNSYYGEMDTALRAHLDECEECRLKLQRMKEMLDSLREAAVPERGDSYGREVWARLLPQLPVRKPKRAWMRWWAAAPAMAAVIVVAFVAGILTERKAGSAFRRRRGNACCWWR